MLDIRFARSGDTNVAYHVLGDGPMDIVYVQGGWSHLEVQWELPAYRRFCEQLGEFARLILFDKSGLGMSDRVPGATPLDVRMDDIRAVMDAVGSTSASLIGASEGGPLSCCSQPPAPNEPTRSSSWARRFGNVKTTIGLGEKPRRRSSRKRCRAT